jgi:hypothetical protein
MLRRAPAASPAWLRAARERVRPFDLTAWAFALWSISFALRGHLPYIRHPYEHNIDEGYLLAVGQRMLHGHMLPFVDGVAHSGPLFLYSGALIASFNEFSWLPIRLAAATATAGITALTFLCGRAAGYPLAGAIASLAIPFVGFFRFTTIDGIAYNAETPVNLFALASLTCALHGWSSSDRVADRSRVRWLAFAGLFASCAALSKQIGALQAIAIAAGVLALAVGHPTLSRAERVRMLAGFCGAAAVPAVLIVGWFALHGALHDLYYYVVAYNRDIYMQPVRGVSRSWDYKQWLETRTIEVGLTVAALAWGLSQVWAARSPRTSFREALWIASFPLTVTLLAFAGIIGARASLRDFDHYYWIAVPWLGLLAGLMAEKSAPAVRDASRLQQVGYCASLLLPLMLASEVAWSMRSSHLTAWSGQKRAIVAVQLHDREPSPCRLIQEHTGPDDTIFVWGFRAELYVTCKRRPASRYVFTSFVAGYVPWDGSTTKQQEDARVVPGSRAILLSELEANKPPIIVDSGRSLGERFMIRYDELSSYLNAHYRLLQIIDGDFIFVRKS